MRRPLKNISFQKGTGGSVGTIVAVTGRTPAVCFFFCFRFFVLCSAGYARSSFSYSGEPMVTTYGVAARCRDVLQPRRLKRHATRLKQTFRTACPEGYYFAMETKNTGIIFST